MKNKYLPVVILASIFGLLAGAAGALFAGSYFLPESSSLYLGRELNLSGYNYLSPSLVIRDPKKVVVNQDLKVDETVRSLESSLLGIFQRQENIEGSYYNLSRPEVKALALTTDGWVLVAWPEKINKVLAEKIKSSYVAVASDRKVYQIDELVFNQERTGSLVFLKLKDASNLSVRRLLGDAEIKVGQSLLVAGADGSFAPDYLKAKSMPGEPVSSDSYPRIMSLAFSKNLASSFIFDLSGGLVAAIDENGQWLPSPILDVYVRSLLRSKIIASPSLGLHYLSLTDVLGDKAWPDKGALIQNSVTDTALLAGGAAAAAGLREGDVIVRVDGVEVNKDHDLSSLIISYASGEKIHLNYLRNGVTMEADVILK